jgi:hypothetical protein
MSTPYLLSALLEWDCWLTVQTASCGCDFPLCQHASQLGTAMAAVGAMATAMATVMVTVMAAVGAAVGAIVTAMVATTMAQQSTKRRQ